MLAVRARSCVALAVRGASCSSGSPVGRRRVRVVAGDAVALTVRRAVSLVSGRRVELGPSAPSALRLGRRGALRGRRCRRGQAEESHELGREEAEDEGEHAPSPCGTSFGSAQGETPFL